ncbi:MAG: peptidase [Gammaproteobacteria bacterium]|nr:peptidase [Gammaproteobacteria bacterium]
MVSFRHRGLRSFFTTGSKVGIQPDHADRLRLILGRLDASVTPLDMDLPGLRLHSLRGGNAALVDYEDYHSP